MTSSSTFDAIFVGAGHNALIAASYLVKEGRSVCLLDQHSTPGGWVRNEELTLPGFVHDTFSTLHPIFVGGPVFAGWEPNSPSMVCAMCRGKRARARRFPTAAQP
jgi:phytoene dehydrogenase-like protein